MYDVTSCSKNSERDGRDRFGLKTSIIVMEVLWTGPFLDISTKNYKKFKMVGFFGFCRNSKKKKVANQILKAKLI